MTVCVAAICDKGKTIILVSDRMIGSGFIESAELKDFEKLKEDGKPKTKKKKKPGEEAPS